MSNCRFALHRSPLPNLLGLLGLVSLMSLAACSKNSEAEANAVVSPEIAAATPSAGMDTISCQIEAAAPIMISTPQTTDGGAFVQKDQLVFYVSASVKRDGQQFKVDAGLLKTPLTIGSPDQGASGIASYQIRDINADLLKEYSQAFYDFYFATQDKDPASWTKLNISKLDSVPSLNSNTPRYHIVGDVSFKAAYAPNKGKEQPACVEEAVIRSVKLGVTYPSFNPTLCAAEKKDIRCEFDLTIDAPSI
jgi:hypothetical protein